MSFVAVISQFANDQKLTGLLALIALDVILGVIAALKPPNEFRLSYVADTLRNDVLFKALPWFAFYAMDKISHSADVAGGLDTGTIAGIVYVGVVAAMSGSILSSTRTIFPELPFPNTIAGAENDAPPKD